MFLYYLSFPISLLTVWMSRLSRLSVYCMSIFCLFVCYPLFVCKISVCLPALSVVSLPAMRLLAACLLTVFCLLFVVCLQTVDFLYAVYLLLSVCFLSIIWSLPFYCLSAVCSHPAYFLSAVIFSLLFVCLSAICSLPTLCWLYVFCLSVCYVVSVNPLSDVCCLPVCHLVSVCTLSSVCILSLFWLLSAVCLLYVCLVAIRSLTVCCLSPACYRLSFYAL